jgi:hypothetical protein
LAVLTPACQVVVEDHEEVALAAGR